MTAEAEIQAAGGVLFRVTADGHQFAIVHRPRYDDWSLPKGKLEPGEGFAAAALREVEEETGFRCELDEELPEVHYAVDGRPKLVRYWLMRVEGGEFRANEEVDELRWERAGGARALLDYEQDARLIDQAEAALARA
jgi:8-oxo-dGTP diphosphatase